MANELVEAEQAANKMTEGITSIVTRAGSVGDCLHFPDKQMYANADECYNEIHQTWKQGEDQRLLFTGPLNEVLKKINQVFKSKLDPLETAKKKLKQSMDAYATAEMIWKRKEDARIAAEKKKADDEALAAAAKLAERGKEKEAETVINQAVADVPKPVVGATDEGQSFTKTVWKADITDIKAFLHAVADHAAFTDFVTIELGELNRYAHVTKGTKKIPGVEFKEVAVVGARR